jgi:hypothetical protein
LAIDDFGLMIADWSAAKLSLSSHDPSATAGGTDLIAIFDSFIHQLRAAPELTV